MKQKYLMKQELKKKLRNNGKSTEEKKTHTNKRNECKNYKRNECKN